MTKYELFFKENYPEYVTEKGECLSPYWDLFSAGVICATFELNIEKEKIKNEIAELKEVHESDKRSLRLIAEKGADLEREISILLSCKNCSENKGGYICQKEYEDKCLAQKIQYIKELKEENAELREGLRDANEKVVHLACNQNKDLKYKLTKAKEIIRQLCSMVRELNNPNVQLTNVDYSLSEAEQFLKECE